MLRFVSHINKIVERCRRKGRLLLLYDFDGTLSPIVDHPYKAKLPASWRRRLGNLSGHPRITVGVVTGRVISDIRRRVGVPGLILAANHGYEVWRGGRCVFRKGGQFRKSMKALGRALAKELGSVPGVIVESKEYSVAVHYRLVPQRKKPAVRSKTMRIVGPYCRRHRWEVMRGKQLIEVRPANFWNKGKAVMWIWRRYAPSALPVYFGDDTTDEDAFRTLGRRGITVRVGARRGSLARYVVDDLDETGPWVRWLLEEF